MRWHFSFKILKYLLNFRAEIFAQLFTVETFSNSLRMHVYKLSVLLKILKSARRSEAPSAVTSHLDPVSYYIHVFLALASKLLGLGLYTVIYIVSKMFNY